MRILLLLLALIAVRFAIGAPLEALGVPMLITGIVTAAALLAVFWKVDREPLRGGYRQLGQGAAIGAGLFTGTLLLIGMFGLLHFDGVNGFGAIWPVLGISILAGVFEELVLRGVVFRWLEQKLGMWWALAISALVFGGLHFFNPGATIFSALAIALEAGVLLGLAYVATRRLWLPIGLHIAWNFTESGIFGVPTSGFAVDGLLRIHLSGPAVFSGGAFGVEGSLITVLTCLTVSYFFLRSIRADRVREEVAPVLGD